MAYLGETSVDLSADENFKHYTQSDWAMYYITRYSGIDGDHHQKWLVDQVARILKGCPVIGAIANWDDHPSEYRFSVGTCQTYEDWVLTMRGDLVDGEYEYDYDEGIAP
jgi:hypothetical protein